MRYRFGEFELDTEAYTLARAGRSQHLRPKVFDVLRFLIENRDRIVTKQELLNALWEVEHINESVVSWSVSDARRALGQKRHEKQPIETLYTRGYRWHGDIEEVDDFPISSLRPKATAEPERGATPSLPFVGRDELMANLRQRLMQAKAGSGGLCMLVGEPGIGKTRCMDEVASTAAAIGFCAWSGRAAEDRWAPPFWPWTQVLRGAAAERNLRARVNPLIAQLNAVGASNATGEQSAAVEAQPTRFLAVDAVARFLLQVSRRRPLLVSLDDLQWADAGTIDLLSSIAPELRRHALFIVTSQREWLDGFRARRARQLARHAERIDLLPLTSGDVGRYIQLVTAEAAPDATLSAAVHSATAGNALFLQEMVRALIRQHGACGLVSLSAADVKPPQLARDVLRERLDALDRETRAVLLTASVLGESFEIELLQKVSDVPIDTLLGALDSGARAGLIHSEDARHRRFRHALLRTVLYDELPDRERIATHRRAAIALEQLAHVAPRHGELAHHYYRSLSLGQPAAVTAAARAAAEEAVRTGEFENAATFCQWALEAQALDQSATPRARVELLLLHGRSARHAGRERIARSAVAQLVSLATRHGFADLLVRAARLLRPGRTWSAFTDSVARAALEETLRITPDASNANHISALSQLAAIAPYALDMQRSKELSAKAVELARTHHEPVLLAEALRARLYALSGPDDIDAVLTVAREMLALDGEASSWISIAAHSARYGAAIHLGDLTGADAALASLERTACKQQRPEALWYHHRLRAQRRFIEGDLAEAEAAFAELSNVRLAHNTWMFRIPQALLALERQGTIAAAAKWDLAALIARTGELPAEAACLARIAVKLGREDLARNVLDHLAADDFGRIPKDIGYLNTLVNLSLVVIELHDRARAEALYTRLAPYPHHNTPSALMYYEGSVSHYLALLAEFLGADERVRGHFDAALAMNKSLGHKLQLARTYYEYARFLFGDQARPDERARQMKAQAQRLAAALGVNTLEAQADAL